MQLFQGPCRNSHRLLATWHEIEIGHAISDSDGQLRTQDGGGYVKWHDDHLLIGIVAENLQ